MNPAVLDALAFLVVLALVAGVGRWLYHRLTTRGMRIVQRENAADIAQRVALTCSKHGYVPPDEAALDGRELVCPKCYQDDLLTQEHSNAR